MIDIAIYALSICSYHLLWCRRYDLMWWFFVKYVSNNWKKNKKISNALKCNSHAEHRLDILSVFHRQEVLVVQSLVPCCYGLCCSTSGLLFCTRRPQAELLSYNRSHNSLSIITTAHCFFCRLTELSANYSSGLVDLSNAKHSTSQYCTWNSKMSTKLTVKTYFWFSA